jgi:hypothetical protein
MHSWWCIFFLSLGVFQIQSSSFLVQVSIIPSQDMALCALASISTGASSNEWKCNGDIPISPTCSWSNVDCDTNGIITTIAADVNPNFLGKGHCGADTLTRMHDKQNSKYSLSLSHFYFVI